MIVMSQQRRLRVENMTRATTIIENGRIANNFWTRLKGLLGVRQLAPGEGLLIAPGHQVHTHFMAFAIDVLYVGADDVVIDVDAGLQPWRFGRWRRKARYVIETPAGAITQTGTSAGDKLNVMVVPVMASKYALPGRLQETASEK
jgi:uncharacterized membrane protein (UPF0127 family)